MVYAIWLSRLKGRTLKQKKEWLREYGSFEDVYRGICEKEKGIDPDLDDARRIEEQCYRKGIYIKSIKEYGVQAYDDLPLILYCRGIWKPFGESIGIVGTRRCTEYGKKITAETAGKLAGEGVTVISGMAKGIDGYAHSAALKAGGYTVAVLGNGPDICFPSEHRPLMEAILKTGLIISEYPPGFHGDRSTFPQRNRIIAAFSDRVLVVESGRHGGALITAEKAREYGKPVYAVPGRIDIPESEGTNELIAHGKAELWLPEYCRSEAVQMTMPLSLNSPRKDSRVTDTIKKNGGNISTERLMEELGCKYHELLEKLTEMEINDEIRVEGEMIWLR